MTTNEIVGRLKAGGLEASSTNRGAAVYVTDATGQRATPGWFGFRIVCDSEATERRVRSILSRFYYIEASGNVWRLKSRNLVPLMAIKRGGVPPTPPTPSGNYLYFEAKQASSTVSMMSMMPTAPSLEYSTDGTTWQTWAHTTADGVHTFDTITLGAVGDKVYLRGTNAGMADEEGNPSVFIFSGSLDSGGSVTSLLDNDGVTMTALQDSGLMMLFGGAMITSTPDTALVTPPTFGNVTSIGGGGCHTMFAQCTALTTPMAMDNIVTIGDEGCTGMYYGCTALASAADMGSVTTIGDMGCSAMYHGCTSLTLVSDGALTFAFPTLPFTDGDGNTYSTPSDVETWMTSSL